MRKICAYCTSAGEVCLQGLGERSRTYVQSRITKLRENCLSEFEKHWNCLELNNQVSICMNAKYGMLTIFHP